MQQTTTIVKGSDKLTYTMNRTDRKFFYVTINGKRINSINYARKWEAKKLLTSFIAHYGFNKAMEVMA